MPAAPTQVAMRRVGRGGSLRRALWTAFAILFLAAAFLGLRKAVSGLRAADVSAALGEIEPLLLALVCGVTAAHYLVLGGYDTTSALRARIAISWRRTALASMVGHAFSHALGFGAVTGSGARVRLYRGWGVGGPDVARIVLGNALTFTVGVAGWGAVLFLAEPFEVPAEVPFLPATLRPLGFGSALVFVAYLALVFVRRAPVRIGRFRLPLPTVRELPRQLAVPFLAWPTNAAILWLLLPAGSGIGPLAFLEIFVLAQVVGLISHVPGGIGVVESILILALEGLVPVAPIVAAFVVYRVVYNVVPFLVALGIFGVLELRSRHERRQDRRARAG